MIIRKGYEMKEEKVYVTLQNGQVYEGKRFGAKGDVLGDAADPSGVLGQINGPDNGDPIQDHLAPCGFLGLDDGGDGGF